MKIVKSEKHALRSPEPAMHLQESTMEREESDPRKAFKQSPSAASHQMRSSLFDFDELKRSPLFTVKRYKDALYLGQTKQGERHGRGVMLYDCGRLYEGFWQAGQRHGKGFELDSDGNKYEGDFRRGKAEGRGSYVWTSGDIYEGEWKGGRKHGRGIWKSALGEQYIGDWRNSEA